FVRRVALGLAALRAAGTTTCKAASPRATRLTNGEKRMGDLRLRFLTSADLCLHDIDASPQFLQLCLQGVALVGSDQLVQALLDVAKALVQPSNFACEMAVLDQRIESLLHSTKAGLDGRGLHLQGLGPHERGLVQR